MAATPYTTLANVKQALGISTTTDDTLINAALAATTTRINTYCNRSMLTGFNKDGSATARIFTATHPEYLTVDDIADATTISVVTGQIGSFINTISTNDFEPLPENASVYNRAVEILRHHWAFWPTWPSVRVQVTAVWGWPAVPDPVVEAQLLWCARLFKRKDSPDGIAGGGAFGPIRVGRMDPDIADLLSAYQRPGFA